jgi:hypothetical protein
MSNNEMTSVFSEKLKYTKIRRKEYDLRGRKHILLKCLTNSKSALAAHALQVSKTFCEAMRNRRSG